MELVTIHTSPHLQELQMLKSLLENNDIDSSILDENLHTVAPHLTFAQEGMRLVIQARDVTKAKQIVSDYLENQPS